MGALRKHQEQIQTAEIIIFPYEQARPEFSSRKKEDSSWSRFMQSEFMDVVMFEIKAFAITGLVAVVVAGSYFAANTGKVKAGVNLTDTSYSEILPKTDSAGFDWASPGRYTR
ncbi:MAG: hypothetical protein R2688_00350 [Fimbriimonadaceae bacterium]